MLDSPSDRIKNEEGVHRFQKSNISLHHSLIADFLSQVYDILRADKIIIEASALQSIQEFYGDSDSE